MKKVDIFISYSHKDNNYVMPIIKGLKELGFSVLYDDEMSAGHDWKKLAKKYIVKTRCAIFMMSENSLTSGPVLEELKMAESKKESIGYHYFTVILGKKKLNDLYSECIEDQMDEDECEIACDILSILGQDRIWLWNHKGIASEIASNLAIDKILPTGSQVDEEEIEEFKREERAKAAIEPEDEEEELEEEIDEGPVEQSSHPSHPYQVQAQTRALSKIYSSFVPAVVFLYVSFFVFNVWLGYKLLAFILEGVVCLITIIAFVSLNRKMKAIPFKEVANKIVTIANVLLGAIFFNAFVFMTIQASKDFSTALLVISIALAVIELFLVGFGHRTKNHWLSISSTIPMIIIVILFYIFVYPESSIAWAIVLLLHALSGIGAMRSLLKRFIPKFPF